MREVHLVGLDYLQAVTDLLQRVRNADPVAGFYQAAELQWWWRQPRRTDEMPQIFWFDDQGRPAAAVIAIDFHAGSSAVFNGTTLAAIVMPGTSPDRTREVIERGLAHADRCGLGEVDFEIDRADDHARRVLTSRGFTHNCDGVVAGWLAAADRPAVSTLPPGYRLRTRAETTGSPHHFSGRSGQQTEERLHQTSLYRPDLDLVILDADGTVGGYGLFWLDPVTATGILEPLRTEEAHQQRGVARHILTAGIDRLAAAGAQRIAVAWEPDNPASGHLYRSVGFEPSVRTEILRGSTATPG